jgi:hypothetical protein
MQEEELLLLLTQSKGWNQDHDMTGMLLYIEGRFLDHLEGRFMQVLEGSEYEVERIFDKIKKDSRHHQLIVLRQDDLDDRNFDNWQMGFSSLKMEDFKRHPGFFELNDEYLDSKEFKDSNTAISFLKSFYDTHRTFDFS